MPRLTNLQPRVKSAFLGLRPSQDRQQTRALNTGSERWRRLRQTILRRDLYQCQGDGTGQHVPGCTRLATEVDHNDGNSHNNDPANLISRSKRCHSAKTRREMQQP